MNELNQNKKQVWQAYTPLGFLCVKSHFEMKGLRISSVCQSKQNLVVILKKTGMKANNIGF